MQQGFFKTETETGYDGYPKYRRRKPGQGGHQVTIRFGRNQEIQVDNRWVVSYCPLLCKTFKAHINIDFCNSIKSIKYVTKYVNKGSDMAMFGLQDVNNNDTVTCYQMARYISSNEVAWRLFNFLLHERYPTVIHGPCILRLVKSLVIGTLIPTSLGRSNSNRKPKVNHTHCFL